MICDLRHRWIREERQSRLLQRAAHVEADLGGFDLAPRLDVEARIVERRGVEQQPAAIDFQLLAERFVTAIVDTQLAAADRRFAGLRGRADAADDTALQAEGVDAHVVAHVDSDFAVHDEPAGSLGGVLVDIARIVGSRDGAGQLRRLYARARESHVASHVHALAVDLEAQVGRRDDAVLGQIGDQQVLAAEMQLALRCRRRSR